MKRTIPIGKKREASFNKAKELLPRLAKQAFPHHTFIHAEDHRSRDDIDGCTDFYLQDKEGNVWAFSSRISYSPGNYISMRLSRRSGSNTEYNKRKNGHGPEMMAHFHLKDGKLVSCHVVKTQNWLDGYNSGNGWAYNAGNAVFWNIDVTELCGVKSLKLPSNDNRRDTDTQELGFQDFIYNRFNGVQ